MRSLAVLTILLSCLLAAHGQSLDGVTVVLDPGHGDRACGEVAADPGAQAESLHGLASECVFTWDTSMRLRRRLQEMGAEVVLTLEDPGENYEPQPWSPDDFPEVPEFHFKTLVDVPRPETTHEALVSRVATANRVYQKADGPVYFLSLHFDSTSPRLAGVSFYYPAWEGGGSDFVELFETALRETGRQRIDLDSGAEAGISAPGTYAVLARSLNPDSYLIELGNIRSLDLEGRNPDLWRMRDPRVRQEYADLIAETVRLHVVMGPPDSGPEKARLLVSKRQAAGLALSILGVLVATLMLKRKTRGLRSGEVEVEVEVEVDEAVSKA